MRAVAVHGCASLVLPRLRRDWRRSAARRCARLPAGSPALRALCTDSSVSSACAQRVQPRATRSTTCSLLAGPLCCCRPASGSLRRATPSWTISGATASARTLATAYPRSPYAHPRVAIALPFTTAHIVVFRALSQRLASVSDVSSGSGSDGTAARGLCVCVCVHCRGSSSQRFRQRKPRSISLKSARMRAKTPKFSLALRGVASRRDAAKKS